MLQASTQLGTTGRSVPDAPARGEANGAGLARGGRQRIGSHLVRGLGHTVGLNQRGLEHLLELADRLRLELPINFLSPL